MTTLTITKPTDLELEKTSAEKANADRVDIEKTTQEKDVFSDIKYICNSTALIVDSLQKGLDIAQLATGDVIVTEVKTINTYYTWDESKSKMVKMGQLQ